MKIITASVVALCFMAAIAAITHYAIASAGSLPDREAHAKH